MLSDCSRLLFIIASSQMAFQWTAKSMEGLMHRLKNYTFEGRKIFQDLPLKKKTAFRRLGLINPMGDFKLFKVCPCEKKIFDSNKSTDLLLCSECGRSRDAADFLQGFLIILFYLKKILLYFRAQILQKNVSCHSFKYTKNVLCLRTRNGIMETK